MSVSDKEAGVEAAYNARQETIRLLQEKGPKIEKVLLRLRQALNAKETKFFAHQGNVIDQKDMIAHNIRLRAVDLALQLHDAMPSQKHEHTEWEHQIKEAEEQQTDEKTTIPS
jgi:hypothetical protein